MANLYGVANAPGLPITILNLPSDTACPANTFTAWITTPALVAPSAGFFYAIIWVNLNVTIGATVPTSISIAAAIGAGSYTGGSNTGVLGLAANGNYYLPFTINTPASQTAWQGLGSTVTIGCNPSGQAITVKATSSTVVALFRAPDQ